MHWELCPHVRSPEHTWRLNVDVLACRRVVNTFVKGCRDFGVCLVSC